MAAFKSPEHRPVVSFENDGRTLVMLRQGRSADGVRLGVGSCEVELPRSVARELSSVLKRFGNGGQYYTEGTTDETQ